MLQFGTLKYNLFYHLENQYFTIWKIMKLWKWFMNNEKINSKIKLLHNSSFVILIFVILKFRNIERSLLNFLNDSKKIEFF